MNDDANTLDRSPVTKRDLIDQNVDKVFADGIPEQEPMTTDIATITSRPGGLPTLAELAAAKALAMAGPLVPEFVRGNPGTMLATMQIAKRYSKYDGRTNSWVGFDPIAVASCMYLVESGGKQSVGYTSQFIGAVLDAFVPWAQRMRYRYEGEGEDRRCTAVGYLKGDPEPFEYTSPPLRLITPKKSPLWQSDPDRQLAYYARRAWARLFAPGVLLGVYDVEELEGDVVHRVRDVNAIQTAAEAAQGLHQRLAAAAASAGPGGREGFQVAPPGAAEAAPEAAAGAPEAPPPIPPTPRREKRASGAARGGAGRSKPAPKPARPGPEADPPRTRSLTNPRHLPGKAAVKAAADRAERKPEPPPLPKNPKEYRRHVLDWLTRYETEQEIEAHWRTEKRLREQCNVAFEERDEVRALVDQRVQQVRK